MFGLHPHKIESVHERAMKRVRLKIGPIHGIALSKHQDGKGTASSSPCHLTRQRLIQI